MIKKFPLIILAAAFLLTSCQNRNTPSPSPTNSSVIEEPKAAPTVSPSETQKTSPPTQLENIESNSEDIIDDISSGDWTAAQSKAKDIKTAFGDLKPILISEKVSATIIDGISSTVDELQVAVNAKNSFDSRTQANHISKYIPDIADYYIAEIPTDIGRLDYLGREIILNAEKPDWQLADNNFVSASTFWDSLKSKMNAENKNDADSFQSNMDSLKTAIGKKDSAETKKLANALLENVDVLEKDFLNKPKT